jgi:hypothetical protein
MNEDKICNLVDSLQELLYTPSAQLADKAIEGIRDVCQPLATKIKIIFPDKKIHQQSAGEPSQIETLVNIEKKYNFLDATSAIFNINDGERYIVACAGIKSPGGYSGIISIIIKPLNPFRHIIGQVLELFASNIVLALSRQTLEKPINLEKILTKASVEMIHIGVEGIMAFHYDSQKQAYWVEKRGKKHKKFTPSTQLLKFFTEELELDIKKIEEICSYLPTSGDFENIKWSEFKAGGKTIIVLFAGKFKSAELIFSKFRSIVSDFDILTSYDEIVTSFNQLKKDHKLVIKGEKIASILETAVAINHEVNNPLTAILGNTQLLLLNKDNLPSDIVAKIITIEKSALRIRQVTQKLMSVVEPITTSYTESLEMLDIEKSTSPKIDE